MVTEFGLSERLGAPSSCYEEEHVLPGKELPQPRQFNERSAKLIDEAARETIGSAEDRTLEIMNESMKALEALGRRSKVLFERGS